MYLFESKREREQAREEGEGGPLGHLPGQPNFALPRQGTNPTRGTGFSVPCWVGMGSSPGRRPGEEDPSSGSLVCLQAGNLWGTSSGPGQEKEGSHFSHPWPRGWPGSLGSKGAPPDWASPPSAGTAPPTPGP